MSKSEELTTASRELGIISFILLEEEGVDFIRSVLERYKPLKTSGHLSIYHDSVSIPLTEYEFTYSKYMSTEPAYVFFEQEGSKPSEVVVIEEGNRLGEVFFNSYGMEYFVSNKKAEYLLAVNWYVIEGIGTAVKWLKKLQSQEI